MSNTTSENENKDFLAALQGVKVPLLVLDQKWHRLFALNGKPENVTLLEKEERELLELQGHLNDEIKNLKIVKAKLMANVVANMEGANTQSADMDKQRADDKRLLEETQQKIADDVDKLAELPSLLAEVNKNLMLATMDFCYNKMRTNTTEVKEITKWIQDVRLELKKNIIKKQNRELNNKEIYSYMHDIFGMELVNVFDLSYDGFDLGIADEKSDEEKALDAAQAKKEAGRKKENINVPDET